MSKPSVRLTIWIAKSRSLSGPPLAEPRDNVVNKERYNEERLSHQIPHELGRTTQ